MSAAQQRIGRHHVTGNGDGRPQQLVELCPGDVAALLVGEVLQLVGEDQLECRPVVRGRPDRDRPFFQRTTDQQVMAARGVQHESWEPLGQGRGDLLTNPVLTGIQKATSPCPPRGRPPPKSFPRGEL